MNACYPPPANITQHCFDDVVDAYCSGRITLEEADRIVRSFYTPRFLIDQRPRLWAYLAGLVLGVLLTLLCVGGSARGAEAAPSGEPAWWIYNPSGGVDGRGLLADVTSRCTPQQRRTAYEPDRVTYCHEATHQLHSRIRNLVGGTGVVNAVYVGEGRCLVLREPRVRLSTVARYVPREYRNDTYQLYLVAQGAHWEHEPLYVLDEAVSYANGTQAARELGIDPHGSDTFMVYFCHYADALVVAVQQHDPQYADLQQLVTFVAWHKQRVRSLSR